MIFTTALHRFTKMYCWKNLIKYLKIYIHKNGNVCKDWKSKNVKLSVTDTDTRRFGQSLT